MSVKRSSRWVAACVMAATGGGLVWSCIGNNEFIWIRRKSEQPQTAERGVCYLVDAAGGTHLRLSITDGSLETGVSGRQQRICVAIGAVPLETFAYPSAPEAALFVERLNAPDLKGDSPYSCEAIQQEDVLEVRKVIVSFIASSEAGGGGSGGAHGDAGGQAGAGGHAPSGEGSVAQGGDGGRAGGRSSGGAGGGSAVGGAGGTGGTGGVAGGGG